MVYVSGTGPKTNEGTYITGKVDQDLTIEEGYDAARLTALNILGSLKGEIGDLNKVVRFVKVIGMVNSRQALINNQLLLMVFLIL